MKKAMLIINPTSGGEKALDYKEILENKAKKYFDDIETSWGCNSLFWKSI